MKSNKYWKISFLVISCLAYSLSYSQEYSWVYFKDKIQHDDYFNTPISTEYLETLSDKNVDIVGESRWLNAACVKTESLTKDIHLLPFVSHIAPLGKYKVTVESIADTHLDFSYGEGDIQIEMLKLDEYHRRGNTGYGVRLALFDGGFNGVDTLDIFASLRENNQIEAAWDFVENDTLRYRESTHGMQVLALAGINHPDSMVGAAPDAQFILARTEDTRSERHIEELNWVRAMEWSDSVGVQIIHSSLGYSVFDSLEGDYTYMDMDGQSTIITLAAQRASQRGIFITNSAGNSGNDPWFYITAPCDGKDVLCVGAVDSFGVITAFSSRGPSADGRIKPEVVAMGGRNTIPRANGILRRGSGTSFSGPLVAGMVACLMEAHPNRTNEEIRNAIIRSSHQADNPDNEYGYGIPDVLKADSILRNYQTAEVKLQSKPEISIYPNPVKDKLTIKCEPNSTFILSNTLGQEVLSGTLYNWINFLDVSELPPGNYVITVNNESSNTVKKVVVE